MSKQLPTRDAVDALLADPGVRERYAGDDATYMAVISRLFRINAHLERTASELFERHGLTRGEADVLGSLYREGDGLAPTRLADTLLCSPGAMTNRLQNLERDGLIERNADPRDRRAATVELTAEGKRRIERAIKDRKAAHEALLPGLTRSEREALIPFLRKILLAMEGNAAAKMPESANP